MLTWSDFRRPNVTWHSMTNMTQHGHEDHRRSIKINEESDENWWSVKIHHTILMITMTGSQGIPKSSKIIQSHFYFKFFWPPGPSSAFSLCRGWNAGAALLAFAPFYSTKCILKILDAWSVVDVVHLRLSEWCLSEWECHAAPVLRIYFHYASFFHLKTWSRCHVMNLLPQPAISWGVWSWGSRSSGSSWSSWAWRIWAAAAKASEASSPGAVVPQTKRANNIKQLQTTWLHNRFGMTFLIYFLISSPSWETNSNAFPATAKCSRYQS